VGKNRCFLVVFWNIPKVQEAYSRPGGIGFENTNRAMTLFFMSFRYATLASSFKRVTLQ